MDETDQAIETERARIVAELRHVADRLEALPTADAIDALTLLVRAADEFLRRAELALRRPVYG
jgi:hypothetical protein